MRKQIGVLFLLLSTSAIGFAQKKITISGTIKEPIDGKMIMVNASGTELAADPKQENITVSPEGAFTISLPVTEEYNWIIAVHGNKRIDFIAEAGSNLQLTAVGSQFDTTVRFEGKGKELSNYFAQYIKNKGGIMTYYRTLQELSALEPNAYPKAIDSVKELEVAYLEQNKNGLAKNFVAYWNDFLRFGTYDAMLNYPMVHEMIKLKSNQIQSIPAASYVVANKAPRVFDDRFLGLSYYQSYVMNYYTSQLSAVGYTNGRPVDASASMEDRKASYKQTDSVLSLLYKNAPKKTAQLIAGRIILGSAKNWTLAELEEHVAAYKNQFPKSENGKVLDAMVKEIKKFNPGQPAVDFSFKTLEGKDMKLSDLKGKVVYMDFWASWCGPCKGEMPHAKKLKEQFKDKDVVFLYVSIDDKEDAWKRGIDAMQIEGIHTRTAGWGGEIAKLYKIQSVPAYYLIDKKGNFVLDKTPRPSQSALLSSEIEKLLQK